MNIKLKTYERKKLKTKLTINDELPIKNSNKKNTKDEHLKQISLETINKEEYANCIKVYTDASKEEDKMGIGIYIESSEESFEYRIDKKNFIMNGELLGIFQAIKLMKNKNQDIVIFTDSKSSLQLLIKGQNQATDNCHVEAILNYITKKTQNKINLQWIPSHIGINGNEKADELAKNGTTSSWYLTNNFTTKESFNQLKQHIYKEWEMDYQEISKKKGKKYFELEKSPRQTPWFQNYRGTSHEIKLLTRIRTDHYLSNKKLKLFKQKQTENCETCKEIDDINHILFKCKKYENIRKKVNLIKNQNNVDELIKNKNYLNYKALYQFLKMAEINL